MFLSIREAQQKIEEHEENLGSPHVTIEPQFQARIQKAVDLVNQKSPGLLNGITDIIGHLDSGPFGRFTTQNPHTIYVNIQKLENELKSRLAGQPDNVIQQELDNQIVKTIMHEATHQKEVTERGYSSEGGPDAAEKQAETFLQPIQLASVSYRKSDIADRFKKPLHVPETLILHLEGDRDQNSDDNPDGTILRNVEEGSKIYRDWISNNSLGSGEAQRAYVYRNGEPYKRISYNGVIWNLDDTPYKKAE